MTNLSARPEGVVHFYNRRGTAEQWIKEGKYALTGHGSPAIVLLLTRCGSSFSSSPTIWELPAQVMLAEENQRLVIT